MFLGVLLLNTAKVIATADFASPSFVRGNHFEISDGEIWNLTLDSEEEINLAREAAPRMITFVIEPTGAAPMTQIVISGLEPLVNYYKYEDGYHNLTEFTADESGTFTYLQNLSSPHLVIIQKSSATTKFIRDDATGGDCYLIGTWDWPTKTCTLNIDLNETIQIDDDGITLDGDGHNLIGAGFGNGVHLYQKNEITIKDLNVTNFTYGVYLLFSSNNNLMSNALNYNHSGIFLDYYSHNNQIFNNVTNYNTNRGIYLRWYDDNNLIENNIANFNVVGISTAGDNNRVNNNTVSHNQIGLHINGHDNTFLNNRFTANRVIGINMTGDILSGNIIESNLIADNAGVYNSRGIYIGSVAHHNIIKNNTIANNPYGIYFEYGSVFDNQIYNNNFIGGALPVYVNPFNYGNVFNLAAPYGGNYWSNFDEPTEGCSDLNNDKFCDAPYYIPVTYPREYDNLPWTEQDGWVGLEQPLPFQAATLVESVVGAPYLWGGKGRDIIDRVFVGSEQIKEIGYYYWNEELNQIDFDRGLDCSGLIFWGYNKAFGVDEVSPESPIYYRGADGQFRNNSEPVSEADLKPGDLLFFDFRPGLPEIDHVAMYVGGEGEFDIINASNPATGIIWSQKDDLKQLSAFRGFRRITQPKISGQIFGRSPIDLVVTDPDGLTITVTTTIITDREILHEIPGVMYYSRGDLENDGTLEDIITMPSLKLGNYQIRVVPEADALPTDTYTLEIVVQGTTTTLAQNALIADIPEQGYGVKYNGSEIIPFVPITMDIKPGNEPNCFNNNGRGVIPLAILGGADFNVNDINPATVRLDGLPIKTVGRNNRLLAHIEDVNRDGFNDLVIQIEDRVDIYSPGASTATLTGNLLNGLPIEGSDTICIVP